MTTAAPSTALVMIQPAFTDAERLALAGFLAGYRGLTREAYALDLRQFTTWCRARSLNLFAVRRADIESSPGIWKPGAGRARPSPGGCASSPGSISTRSKRNSSSTRPPRTSAVRGWTASPMPSRSTVTSSVPCWSPPGSGHRPSTRISLLALNGLRVSEATGADIEHLGLERGHRTLTITRKGDKVVTLPLAPRTARAIDLAIGERASGPVFLAADGRRLDRHGAGRIVRHTARRARHRQSRHASYAEACVHHRRAGCRGAAAGRARGGVARGSADHDAV